MLEPCRWSQRSPLGTPKACKRRYNSSEKSQIPLKQIKSRLAGYLMRSGSDDTEIQSSSNDVVNEREAMATAMHQLGQYNRSVACQPYRKIISRGIWVGDNPFTFATPVLLSQLSLSAFVTGTLQFILTPLGETAFVSQMIGGLLTGPLFLGRNRKLEARIFPEDSFYVYETFAFFGCLFFLFLVGVKMDLSMVKKSGKKALVIGLSSFFVPLIVNTSISFILMETVTMDPILRPSLPFVAAFQSVCSFHVIADLLTDLKLLNSELGHLAMSSSMISGMCSWVSMGIILTVQQNLTSEHHPTLWVCLSLFAMVITIIYILRPLMFWMVRKTAEGKAIKEFYIFIVFLMVLVCSFFGDVLGQHFLFGPVVLGLAVPGGPPLGAALVDKLDSFVSCILLPSYFAASGAQIDLFSVERRNFGVLQLMVFSSFMGKLMGTMVPSLYCRMPFRDALSLGLILNAKGLVDLLLLKRAMQLKLIDQQSYCILVVSMVLVTGTISPLVKILYNPSMRSTAYTRRTILHAKPDAELRILVCIYRQDNVPSIINLLEASNPTRESPLLIYVLHLIELLGRASPVLVAHQKDRMRSSHPNRSEHIINAFRLYERQNKETVSVYPYTAVSPYGTMHSDISGLALDKNATLVIVPFHKQWTMGGTIESINAIRNVNRNILNKAPCSIGILVDRGTFSGSLSISLSKSLYSVGVIFLGGSDDREALAYAMRMSKHPNVNLTAIRILEHGQKNRMMTEGNLDNEMIKELRMGNMENERVEYREEKVRNGIGTARVIRSLENSYDLILVGRRHATDSPLLRGLKDWNEFPELGYIGDMVASTDSDCEASILVVQQQAYLAEALLDSPKYHEPDYCAVVLVPRHVAKVRPISR
ncbi:hypothetical protein HHK36_010633 [Tetracentron sinense]|uniref:Cation/H+ exchanger domain-containing protein n=1 Tax=Tetracentron sinense TaxID=13715 RepID=A0A834ZCB4_TETSI|nr:hypothetical protein HHK36_010633 [Tetracentron sinense]